MFLLVATLAHAGLRADLDREATDAPQIAVACSSAKEAMGRLEELAAEMSESDPMPPDVARAMTGLGALLSTDGRLAFSWWEKPSTLRIGMETTLSAAEFAEAVAKIDAEDPARVEQGPDGWQVVDSDGTVTRVAVTEGWAVMSQGTPPQRTPRPLPAALLAALPDGGGCSFAVTMPDEKLGSMDIAFHLPSERGRPASFAMATPVLQDSPAILLQGAVPPKVATPEVPEALVVLGIGLDSIDFSMFLKDKELRQARRFQNLFPITGGTTLALLQSTPTPRLAAAIPFARNMPARRIAARTRALAKELKFPVERVDATHLVVVVGKTEILLAARDGLLYVATDPGTLNALERGAGEPWLDGQLAEVAAEWPLLVASRVIPSTSGGPSAPLPRPFLFTLDVEGGVVKGLVDVPLSLAQIKQIGETFKAAREARELRKKQAEMIGEPGGTLDGGDAN